MIPAEITIYTWDMKEAFFLLSSEKSLKMDNEFAEEILGSS